MKTIITTLILTLLSSNLWANPEAAKGCMSSAIIKSRNFKIQDLAINVSVDDTVTFSCKNLTHLDVKELQVIREDQKKVIETVYTKLKSGKSVNGLEFSRLGATVGNRNVSSGEMCSVIETNYQTQISTALNNTFQKELKRCPSARAELLSRYEKIISSASIKNLAVKDACNTIVKKIEALKETYVSTCGMAPVRHRNKLGLFASRK